MWKGDVVGAPPGDPDSEGSDVGPGHGTSWVTNQFHMVTVNHGRDSTDGMQNDASHENQHRLD